MLRVRSKHKTPRVDVRLSDAVVTHKGMLGLLTTPLKEAELTQLDALQREIVRINCCKGIYAG